MAQEMGNEAMAEVREAVSIGAGLWLSLAGTLLLACLGLQSVQMKGCA